MENLLLKNGEVLLPNGSVQQLDIIIENNFIMALGHAPLNWQGEVLDCTGKLAIPGFINTHTHAAMTLFRSYADDMLLMDWLKKKIWPAEAKLTGEDVYWGSLLAIAEMLKSGTTAFADMYFFMDDVARAVAETGIRASLARGMAGVAPTGEQALLESESFYTQFNGAADGRISVMLGPHAPYTCPPAYLRKVVAMSEKLGAEVHIHLSETAGEVEDCLKEHGKTPIALMEEVGLLQRGVLAAHCVHVTPDDIQLMAERKVRVAHNPGSNMKLASGIAPVEDMLKAGLCVGLGTDGASSNNNLDMMEELRLAALLQKVNRYDPLVIPAGTALSMATENGARCLGFEKTGKIEAGYRADITLVNMNEPHWYPRHDCLSLLVYAAQGRDVDTVLVDGRILMKNRQLTTIDEERLAHEVQKRAMRLVKQ
ncbi:MAG: mtaD [Anaerosporomusa subterranea]|jgi:5-methylthioadenosine/S-adenosylhomocysteine deaminase|nr:mtaD [Anaerosporomusa subterranea]